MTRPLADILVVVDRVAAGITADPHGHDRFEALVQELAPYVLGSPRLLREAVERAYESGLVPQSAIGNAVARYEEDEREVDAAMAADEVG